MNRKPNLFIIGAMKSGTTSLHSYLASHPDIFMSRPKEPMHFSREENWKKGNEAYFKLFSDSETEKYIGESSTEYAKLPFRKGVARRLHEFNPQARLIYIMRDPFERIISQYKHMVKTGRTTNSLIEEIKDSSEYLTNSYYAYQLRPYLDLYGRDAIFVGLFEDLASDPEEFCKNIFRWLEINDSIAISNIRKVANSSPRSIVINESGSLIWKILKRLDKIKFLSNITPGFLRRLLRGSISNTVEIDFLSEEFKNEVVLAREILNPILNNWTEELDKLIDLNMEQWPVTSRTSGGQPRVLNVTREIENKVDQLIGDSQIKE